MALSCGLTSADSWVRMPVMNWSTDCCSNRAALARTICSRPALCDSIVHRSRNDRTAPMTVVVRRWAVISVLSR
jgi:hypothetical protein